MAEVPPGLAHAEPLGALLPELAHAEPLGGFGYPWDEFVTRPRIVLLREHHRTNPRVSPERMNEDLKAARDQIFVARERLCCLVGQQISSMNAPVWTNPSSDKILNRSG